MIMKQYVCQADTGNERFPFLICNATPKNIGRHFEYVDCITEEEIAAPSLTIKPLEDENLFWHHLISGYNDDKNTPIPVRSEVLAALRGQSTDWKLVRCGLTWANFVFVLVNPEVYAKGIKFQPEDELYNSYEADIQEGKTYVWVESLASLKFKLKVKHFKDGKVKTYRRYHILTSDGYTVLTEYSKKMTRISEIYSDRYEKREMDTVYVTEILK